MDFIKRKLNLIDEIAQIENQSKLPGASETFSTNVASNGAQEWFDILSEEPKPKETKS
ncbi:MAG: hypothetical protein OHK0053_11520 [Microscillaceae bacterium]